jgi:nucleoside-diphosphate-sugar epimerase
MNPLANDLDHVLALTRDLWEEIRGQNIFISGGTGFFGTWLVESFCWINRILALNARVTILSRNPERFAHKSPHLASDPSVSLIPGDIRDFTFPEGEFRYFIHAATEASARQALGEPLEMLSTILAGTQRALDFASTHGTSQFLLTSSGAVYGKQPPNMTHVPESYTGAPDPLDPVSVYAEGKRAAELMCAIYQKTKGLECKIARCWAFCGPHLPLDQHFAIGNFIRDVLEGRPIQISGDGTPRRSYLYAADLVIWLWTILLKAPPLVAFNIGSANNVSILELAQIVAATLNPHTEIHVARQPDAATQLARYVPSVNRAFEMLGLRETICLEESIRRTAAWNRFNS